MLKKKWVILIIIIFIIGFSLLVFRSFVKDNSQSTENILNAEFVKVSKDGTSFEIPKGYIPTNREGAFYSFETNLIKGTGTNRFFEVALYKREIDKNIDNAISEEFCRDTAEKIASSRKGNIRHSKVITTDSGLNGCLTFIDFGAIGRSYSAYFPRESDYSLELGHVYSTTNTKGTEEDHEKLFTKIAESVSFE